MTGRFLKTAISAAFAAVIGLGAGSALGAMTPDAVKSAIEGEYPVKVLKVTEATVGDKPVYRVTMMFNGGNFNTAYQVNTIIVDAETGKPIVQFGSAPTGHNTASGAPRYETNRQTINAINGNIRR